MCFEVCKWSVVVRVGGASFKAASIWVKIFVWTAASPNARLRDCFAVHSLCKHKSIAVIAAFCYGSMFSNRLPNFQFMSAAFPEPFCLLLQTRSSPL